MDELLALLERYAPGYGAQIEGYPDMLVDELEEVFGRPLPAVYRHFAQVMGTRGGPLLSTVTTYDPLLDVANLYRVLPLEMPPRRFLPLEMPPRRFLYVFGDPDPLAPNPYWLDLESPSEEGDCQVVRMSLGADSWKKKLYRQAFSLRELLFLWAMEHVHLPTLPHQARYLRGEGRAEDLVPLLEKDGLRAAPLPRAQPALRTGGAAVWLYRPPEGPHFTLRVGMRSPEELKRFQLLLEDHTDLGKSPF